MTLLFLIVIISAFSQNNMAVCITEKRLCSGDLQYQFLGVYVVLQEVHGFNKQVRK